MADQPSPVGAELEAIVAQGIADCEQSALEAAVRDDPLRLPYVALASFLKAQRSLFLEARQPLSENVIKQGVARGVSVHSATVAKQLVRRNLMLFAGLLTAALVLGGGIGYWAGSGRPPAIGVAAGAQQCSDRADGGRLCWIPVWAKLPPIHQ